jgi:hypothetical protein
MNSKQMGVLGAILVGVSSILPSVSLPIVGAMNYYYTDHILPTFIVIALIGLIGASRGSKGLLWIAGLIAAVVNGIYIMRINQIAAQMQTDSVDAGGLAGSLGTVMAGAIQIQYGVFVSIAGAILLIISAVQTQK